jgi:Peroxidase, family 2
MLNTFANHGFLTRDGRNITKDEFNNAQVAALNFHPDLASGTTNAMVAKLGSPKNSSAAFDLEDFASHSYTEHDASLTRLDILQGSVVDVNPGLVLKLLDDSSLPWLNTSSVGRSRARREAESKAIGSPPLSDAFTHFAQLESSFILLVFGVGGDQNSIDKIGAPKDRLKEFLNEERFPINKGWQKSETVVTSDLQKAIIAGIQKYHDEFVGNGTHQ